MKKTLLGKVTSIDMKDTVVIEVSRKQPHPLYKKLMQRSKKYKVAMNGQTPTVGDMVVATETRPLSKDKYFMVTEVIKQVAKGGQK